MDKQISHGPFKLLESIFVQRKEKGYLYGVCCSSLPALSLTTANHFYLFSIYFSRSAKIFSPLARADSISPTM